MPRRAVAYIAETMVQLAKYQNRDGVFLEPYLRDR